MAKTSMYTYFKPEEWQDAEGVKHNRVILVATKFYEAVEKENTPDSQQGKTRGCVKTPKNSQNPDFPKPGLCYVQKFLYL